MDELKFEESQIPMLISEPQTYRKIKAVKPTVDIINMATDLPLAYLDNSLELLLQTLARAFKLKPLTAAGLLTNNNEFLKTACCKGVKHYGMQPLFDWYAELQQNVSVLCELMFDEYAEFENKKQFTEVLKTIASGLVSPCEQLVSQTYFVLVKCFEMLDQKSQMMQVLVYQFLVSQDEGNLFTMIV
jgi:hypothetical protein